MRHNTAPIKWIPLLCACMICLGMLLGIMLAPKLSTDPGQRKLLEVFDIIQDEYVDSIPTSELVENALPYLLQQLDPHSSYIPAGDLARVNEKLESSFGGIGIKFQQFSDTVCVAEVIAKGPADVAGIRPGDRIVKVDNKDITGKELTTDDIFKKLRGPIGTQVKLEVVRRGEAKPLTVWIKRGSIPQPSVDGSYVNADGVGYIHVERFARDTYREFVLAMEKLKADGAKSFIIDLRGNVGGFMESALFMANEFLQQGQGIVSTRGRQPDDESNIRSDGTGRYQNAPVVLLIDEMSASASEILSGALQDNDRALIVGRRSFGKGLVQKPITLSDGSEIRLTIQRYFTPSGRSIQKKYDGTDPLAYEEEVYQRYLNGENFGVAKEEPRDPKLMFKTLNGRKVYGGGGITPDVFVPSDTSMRTSYYLKAINQGLLQQYAYEYVDLNREDLSRYKTVKDLMGALDSDGVLLSSFVSYAASKGLPARWYYIRISAPLIVNQLKALIAGDLLGHSAFLEVYNQRDTDVQRALKELKAGTARTPIRVSHER